MLLVDAPRRTGPTEPTLIVYLPAAVTGALFVVFVAWRALRAQAVDTDATLFVAVPALVCASAVLGALVPDRGWRHGAVAGIAAGLLTASVLAVGGLRAPTLVRVSTLLVALAVATAFASEVGARVRRALGAHRVQR